MPPQVVQHTSMRMMRPAQHSCQWHSCSFEFSHVTITAPAYCFSAAAAVFAVSAVPQLSGLCRATAAGKAVSGWFSLAVDSAVSSSHTLQCSAVLQSRRLSGEWHEAGAPGSRPAVAAATAGAQVSLCAGVMAAVGVCWMAGSGP